MNTLIVVVFVLGYLAIAFEHKLKVSKAASALLIGVVCWSLYVVNIDSLLPLDAIPNWFQVVPLLGLSYVMPGKLAPSESRSVIESDIRPWHQWLFLLLGLAGLVVVPIFKTYTHLPPYMGMMLSLSVLWIVSEWVGHTLSEETRSTTGVLPALRRMDMSSILFFLGILLAVGALGATGMLQATALWLDQVLPNRDVVAIVIGLVSAIVDNVPLVAAGINMYDLPMDNDFWMLLAYCAGTGGSCLIIGLAAGVVAMGLDHLDFLWYVRKIAPWALLGYLAGAAVVVAMQTL